MSYWLPVVLTTNLPANYYNQLMLSESKRISRIALPVCCLLLLLIVTGCNFKSSDANKDDKEKKEQAIPVEVASITNGPIETTLKSSWYLEAEEQVKVIARTSNRVKELLVEEGDEVEKDQVLARLEDQEQLTAVNKAQNQLNKTRTDYARINKLFEQNLISEKEHADAKFEVRQLELSLDESERQLEFTEIRAPIKGTVTLRLISLGDLISNGKELFEIIDFDSIVAYVAVPDKNLAQLRADQPVRITTTARPGQEFAAYVKRIAPIVEAKTGMVKVTIGVKKTPLLRPGMYIEAEIVLATKKNALLISRRALVFDGSQFFVYRMKPDRRVERLLLTPAMEDKFYIEPATGFSEGDQIVMAGHTGLKDDALVRLPGDPNPDKDKKDKDASADQPAESGAKESTGHSS